MFQVGNVFHYIYPPPYSYPWPVAKRGVIIVAAASHGPQEADSWLLFVNLMQMIRLKACEEFSTRV